MDLEPDSEEHRLLREGARRVLAGAFDADRLCRGVALDGVAVEAAWSVASKMGWTGLRVSAEKGGLGLGMAEAAILCEEMGRALFPAPYAATAVVTPAVLARFQPSDRLDRILAKIADGTIRIAMPGAAELSLERAGSRSGRRNSPSMKRDFVEYAASATHALLIASEAEETHRAFLVPLAAAAPTTIHHDPLDPSCPIAGLEFAAPLPEGGIDSELSTDALEEIAAIAHVAVAAELAGVAGASFDLAVAYAKERHQFGVPIGSFQAIKHRLVDCFVFIENAHSAVGHAAAAIDAADTDRSMAADAARSVAIDAALWVASECIQIHGALGFSAEHKAHLYLKRARRLAATLGGSAVARRAIGARLAGVAESSDLDLFTARAGVS